MFLRDGVVVPVVLVVAEVVHEGRGHVDLPLQHSRTEKRVRRAGLQQQNRILAKLFLRYNVNQSSIIFFLNYITNQKTTYTQLYY